MRPSISSWTILSISLVSASPFGIPGNIGNLHIPEVSSFDQSPYDNWQPAGPGDRRPKSLPMDELFCKSQLPAAWCCATLTATDGRNITIPLMKHVFKKYANIGPDVAELLGNTSLSIVGPGATSFTLKDIRAHNVIEHDGSLSRSDYALGDDYDFNATYMGEAARYFLKPTINVTDAAEARLARMTTMKKVNPKFNLTMAGFTGSFIEQSFYLSIFGDPYKGVARSDWVLEWFYFERLPTFLGWTPRTHETNLTTLMAMAKRVMAATPDTVVPPDNCFFLGH